MLKMILLSLLATYLVVAVGLYLGQRRLLYFPDPTRTPPAAVGLADVTERLIATPDGQHLVAWYGKAKPGQPTLLYFHGNGGSLAGRAGLMRRYLDHGWGVLMMSYRGYSGSTGAPTEVANVADAALAYDLLIKDGIQPSDLIIYGESLGTGVGIQLAATKPVAGIILDSPFTSVVDRGAEIYPWLPVRTLARDRYESSRYIGRIRAPLLIVHGEADEVVPVRMGRRMFELANEPKQLRTFPGAGHDNHGQFGSLEAVFDWVDRLRSDTVKK